MNVCTYICIYIYVCIDERSTTLKMPCKTKLTEAGGFSLGPRHGTCVRCCLLSRAINRSDISNAATDRQLTFRAAALLPFHIERSQHNVLSSSIL